MKTMKAIRIHQYRGPEVLRYEDAPRPVPGPREALVRVRAAGVNPVDWKTRDGYLKQILAQAFPIVPGWDCAGVVEALGEEANWAKPGDEVFAFVDLVRPRCYLPLSDAHKAHELSQTGHTRGKIVLRI
jgi:NADPH:quinone reductase-like Zn-dependent oxidoreductase